MIGERLFFYPKPAHYHELADLLKSEIQRVSSPHLRAVRLFSEDIGCTASFAQELELGTMGSG